MTQDVKTQLSTCCGFLLCAPDLWCGWLAEMTQDVKTQLSTCCGYLLCALELAVKNTASEVPHGDVSGWTAQNF